MTVKKTKVAKLSIEGFKKEIAQLKKLQQKMKGTVGTAIEMGKILQRVKDDGEHGTFDRALKEIKINHRSATDYIKLAKHAAKIKNTASIREALDTLREMLPKRERVKNKKPSEGPKTKTIFALLDKIKVAALSEKEKKSLLSRLDKIRALLVPTVKTVPVVPVESLTAKEGELV